jgi:hypothetical protein
MLSLLKMRTVKWKLDRTQFYQVGFYEKERLLGVRWKIRVMTFMNHPFLWISVAENRTVPTTFSENHQTPRSKYSFSILEVVAVQQTDR